MSFIHIPFPHTLQIIHIHVIHPQTIHLINNCQTFLCPEYITTPDMDDATSLNRERSFETEFVESDGPLHGVKVNDMNFLL